MTPSLEEGRGGPHATMGPKEEEDEEEEKIILHVWSRREMERGEEGTSSTLDEDEEPQWDHTVVYLLLRPRRATLVRGRGSKHTNVRNSMDFYLSVQCTCTYGT